MPGLMMCSGSQVLAQEALRQRVQSVALRHPQQGWRERAVVAPRAAVMDPAAAAEVVLHQLDHNCLQPEAQRCCVSSLSLGPHVQED
jgi:hypothetical protein